MTTRWWLGPWPLRVVWLVLPLGAGPALADALADASRPVQLVCSLGGWAAWGGGLLALLVPRASSLTALRLAVPAVLAAAVAAAARGPAGADDAIAVALGAAALGSLLLPGVPDTFVDGSSYGDERRFALRVPPALLPAATVAWVLAVALPATSALALAAGAWVPGAFLAVAAVPGVRVGVPAIHRLARRWLVFVPAGLVVHDHQALAEPVLLRRGDVFGIGPAPVDAADRALDLTLGAGGLLLLVDLSGPGAFGVLAGAGRARRPVETEAERVLVAPLRPGAVLADARERRLPIGTA